MKRTIKIVLGVSLIAFALLILIGIIKFGSLLALFFIYPWMSGSLTDAGLNPFVAKAVSIGMSIFLWAVIFGLIIKWRSGKEMWCGISKRTWGIVVLIAFFMFHALTMFTMTRESYFSQTTGSALKYYTQNPMTGEIQLFDHEGYDTYGQKAKPITSEIAKEIAARKMYPQAEISKGQIQNFFDRLTGKPLVYYYQDEKGTCHFFARPGYSPVTGSRLLPVTSEVLERCSQEQAKILQEKEKYEKEKELLKNQKTELENQAAQLANLKSALEKEKEKLTLNKQATAQETAGVEKKIAEFNKKVRQFNKEKAQFENEKMALAEDGQDISRPAAGQIFWKGKEKLEIHLDLMQPVSKR